MLEKSHRQKEHVLLLHTNPSRSLYTFSPLIFSVLLSIYITQRHALQRGAADFMKILNISETRSVSHTLHFKLCSAETKDQPKREAQVNKEKLKPQAHCISL